jgi:C-8 sterol isomerase
VGYIFDPDTLHQIARKELGLLDDGTPPGRPIEEIIRGLRTGLARRYPGHIEMDETWILNVAGGAMGQMQLLHSSITEYLMIFGTPIGTEGHTGRFFATDYFYILEGEQWAYREGELEKRIYKPGDCHVHPFRAAGGYRMPDRCFAMEYARGAIPAMLPFGIADAATSTLDGKSVAKTFKAYAKAVVRNLAHGKI